MCKWNKEARAALVRVYQIWHTYSYVYSINCICVHVWLIAHSSAGAYYMNAHAGHTRGQVGHTAATLNICAAASAALFIYVH